MSRRELTAEERQSYREQLRELYARLTGDVTQLQSEATQPSGGSAGSDAEDPGAREAEEGVARSLLASEEKLLAEVQSALTRLSAGTFGACEACGHPITRERLDAVPYARTCIRCARSAAPA